MDIDGAPVEVVAAPVNVVPQGSDGRPFCEKHNCLMVASGTKDRVTYYKCPVPGCDCREKRARPTTPIPSAPQVCQFQTCKTPPQYLERDFDDKSIGQLAMVCPKCGNKHYVTRPTYAAKPPKLIDKNVVAGFDER